MSAPAAPEFRPVRYWLDDGLWTPAVLVSQAQAGDALIVNLNTEAGRTVIGVPGWFSAEYVALWNGLVPECCDPGTDPGQWSSLSVAVRLEVKANQWGDVLLRGGWHPAVTGSLNGSGEPDDDASQFATEAEAARFVAECIPDAVATGDGTWRIGDALLRTVEVRS